MAELFHTGTEYVAHELTILRGDVDDIESVGVYHTIDPKEVPAVDDFTEVQLVHGDDPLADGDRIDVLTLVGPRNGDVELEPGDCQAWVHVRTETEDVLRRSGVLEVHYVEAIYVDGWLQVPCDAHDMARVAIAVGAQQPGPFKPAFRDWRNGHKVAKVRTAQRGKLRVWIRVGHDERRLGPITI